jgi:hypothetical protein
VHKNSQPRIFTDERAGRAGVIQMNVGQKESVEIADPQAVNGQLFAKIGNRGRWPGIHQCDSIAGTKQG